MRVTIEEKSAKPMFNRGDLVVHLIGDEKVIVIVDHDLNHTSFSGTVLFCSSILYDVGHRSNGWTKACFEPFNGKLTIEV